MDRKFNDHMIKINILPTPTFAIDTFIILYANFDLICKIIFLNKNLSFLNNTL